MYYFFHVIRLFTENEGVVVLVQYLISYSSIILLYKAVVDIFGSITQGFITALIYLFFIDIITWNSYLLAESLYASMVCISLYLLWQVRNKPSLRLISLTSLVVVFTIFIKPTGIGLLGALGVVWLVRTLRKIQSGAMRSALAVGIILIFLAVVNRMLTTYLIIENYKIGEIIYAITTLPNHPDLDQMVITPPANAYEPPAEWPQIIRIPAFIIHHPVYWLKLFFSKVFYFLVHIRPYWSWSHNAVSLVFLIPAYLLAIRALVKGRLHGELRIFFLAYVTIHTLSVSLTSVDWDGRFIVPIIPVLFIAAVQGLSKPKSSI